MDCSVPGSSVPGDSPGMKNTEVGCHILFQGIFPTQESNWDLLHCSNNAWIRLSDFTFTFMHWRRKWQSTPVFLPGESQGRGAWWAAVYGVTQSRTRLKRLSSSSNHACPSPFLEKGFCPELSGSLDILRLSCLSPLQGPAVNLPLLWTLMFWYQLASLCVGHLELNFGDSMLVNSCKKCWGLFYVLHTRKLLQPSGHAVIVLLSSLFHRWGNWVIELKKGKVWGSNPGSLARNTLPSTVFHRGMKNRNNEVEFEKWRQSLENRKVRSLFLTK